MDYQSDLSVPSEPWKDETSSVRSSVLYIWTSPSHPWAPDTGCHRTSMGAFSQFASMNPPLLVVVLVMVVVVVMVMMVLLALVLVVVLMVVRGGCGRHPLSPFGAPVGPLLEPVSFHPRLLSLTHLPMLVAWIADSLPITSNFNRAVPPLFSSSRSLPLPTIPVKFRYPIGSRYSP